MALAGMLLSAVFVLGIVMNVVPLLMLHPFDLGKYPQARPSRRSNTASAPHTTPAASHMLSIISTT